MKIDFTKGAGLVPAIIQHSETNEVLMLGYMNEESLELTKNSGLVTFFSRSRNKIWMKGETSGNQLKLISITNDCDNDTLLIKAIPNGPVCHKGTLSCFPSDTKINKDFLESAGLYTTDTTPPISADEDIIDNFNINDNVDTQQALLGISIIQDTTFGTFGSDRIQLRTNYNGTGDSISSLTFLQLHNYYRFSL